MRLKTLECHISSTTLQFYVNHGLICSAQRVQPFISYPWSKLQTFCHRKVTPKFKLFSRSCLTFDAILRPKLWNAISCQQLCGLLKTMNYFVPHNEFNLLSPIHEINFKRFDIEKWPQNLIVFLKFLDIWCHFETQNFGMPYLVNHFAVLCKPWIILFRTTSSTFYLLSMKQISNVLP